MSETNPQRERAGDDFQAVVARYAAGDREAGDEICRKFEQMAHAIAAQVLGPENSADWESTRQVALARLLSKLDAWRPEVPFGDYAAVVLTRSIIDSTREATKATPAELDTRDAPFRVHAQIQYALYLVAAVDPRWRQFLELKLDGLPHDEIAPLINVSHEMIEHWWPQIKEYLSAFFSPELTR